MENILQVKGLCKKYPSFKLDNVSFSIAKGEIAGFIGRNGAGKTTTLKCLANLVHKDDGDITMFGLDFKKNEEECKTKIAFVLEGIDYYPRVKIKKLTEVTRRYYPKWDEKKYRKYLRAFGLKEDLTMKQMSNGMKLKYQLAVSLSHGGDLLIFDEPTSGLDPISRDEIQEIFKTIVSDKNKSILFSTHITTDLEKCADKIIYLSHGRIVMEKSKEAFLASFKLIEGEKNLLERKEFIASLISYRVEEDRLVGLGYSDKIIHINNVVERAPNLDEIMIFYERGQENEKFAL
ncbi:MAG: ABC transporter ATP-binding protein [Bacilli bacterium]|jgi:ABC-2 type transport system ATP-binding protein|nr:ABC transporter ATP-binding protein [Bacilli bacterium]